MTTEDKLLKLRKLADAMYYAAQYLTTDASRLHKAMDEYHKFIIHEWREEPKPKFKVGDCIRPIDSCLGSQRTICEVCDGWYVTNQGTLDFEYEDNWELVEDSVHRTKAEVDAAMQDVEEKSKAFTDAHKGESAEEILAQMTNKEAIKYLQQLYPNGGHCWLDEQRIEAIGMAVKALQEEPVSERFAFKAIPRLLEMIEPTDRAKAYIAKLVDTLDVEGYSTDAKIVRESLKIMNGEKVAMATMDEKPIEVGK